jgi:hypothetical protein
MGVMNMKMKTLAMLAALAAAFATTLACAQGGSIARLKDVKGNVLVSQQAGLASGSEAVRLAEHTRVITTAGSEVIVVYDNGCEVRLKENQRFEVVVDKACAALVAENLLVETPGAAGVGIAALFIPAGGVGIASGVAGVGIDSTLFRGGNPTPTPLSPN